MHIIYYCNSDRYCILTTEVRVHCEQFQMRYMCYFFFINDLRCSRNRWKKCVVNFHLRVNKFIRLRKPIFKTEILTCSIWVLAFFNGTIRFSTHHLTGLHAWMLTKKKLTSSFFLSSFELAIPLVAMNLCDADAEKNKNTHTLLKCELNEQNLIMHRN